MEVKCRKCEKTYELAITAEQLDKWEKGGGLIEDAMPHLTAGERELLISGLCDPCYERLFGGC